MVDGCRANTVQFANSVVGRQTSKLKIVLVLGHFADAVDQGNRAGLLHPRFQDIAVLHRTGPPNFETLDARSVTALRNVVHGSKFRTAIFLEEQSTKFKKRIASCEDRRSLF